MRVGVSFLSLPHRSQSRQDQCTKQVVHFLRRKRAPALRPPIQYENECRGDVLDEQILWNPFAASLQPSSHVIGNEFTEHLLKVRMNDGAPPRSHSGLTRPPVPLVVLEDRQAEPNNAFVARCRGSSRRRWNGAEHVMDATDKQVVFVTEVRIKG